MEVLKPLLGSSFRSQHALDALSQLFLGYAGKPLDLLYSRLGGLNGRFFPQGWGNLGIVNLKEDIDLIKQGAWASEGIKVDWKLLQQGKWEGVPCKLYEGTYRTPCVNRIYDALPLESRTGRVQMLMPAAGLGATQLQAGSEPLFSKRHTPAAVLHLAATGDHGFSRRLRLGAPLLQQGVCQLVHESPYYGARRPPEQRGSKLCAVSDLLALGWATIYESLCLLGWLESEGVEQRGICGLSMGGVHASMTAGLYPRPLAITPLLTPRSAAVAYCYGALAPLMAWRALLQEKDVADNEVERVVAAAAQPVSLLHRARYVRLQHLEQQLEMVEGTLELWQQQQQQQQQQNQHHQQPSAQQQREATHSLEAVAAVQQAAALAAVTEAAAAEQLMADSKQQQQQRQQHGRGWQQCAWLPHASGVPYDPDTSVADIASPPSHALLQHGMCAALRSASSGSSSSSSNSNVSSVVEAGSSMHQQQQQQKQLHHHHRQQQHQQISAAKEPDSWRRQVWRQHFESSVAELEVAAAATNQNGLIAALAPEAPPADTFRRLRHVLETYTDVTRYPRPVRPDAAVLVAARHDGYVDMASVKALQEHWPGSELRTVNGGHVSAFLMHQNAFRGALRDSLARLEAGARAADA